MKTSLFLTLVVVSLCSLSLVANCQTANDQTKESKATERVQAAAEVLNEIQGTPDKGIPGEVLGSAECVAVVPSMLKGGFIVGAKYGCGSGNADHEQRRHEASAVEQVCPGCRCLGGGGTCGAPCRGEYRLEDAGAGADLFARAGDFCRRELERSSGEAGQGQHAGILRTHGAVPYRADGRN